MSDKTNMKKPGLFSSIRGKTTLYIISSVVVVYIITGTVLFISLLNTQRDFTTSEFVNITSRHVANFERKINTALDYLSSVTSVLEFQISEGITDREVLQRTMYFMFDGHTVDSSSIYIEPNMYDGKDDEYIGTVYGTAATGRIAFYYYRHNGRTGYRQEALYGDRGFTLPVYIDTKAANAPTYTSPTVYNIDGVDTLMFAIAYPILGQRGEFIGVVTANIILSELYELLNEEEIFETGYLIIANDKSDVIYSPIYEDIGRTREEAGLDYPLPPDDVALSIFNARSMINDKRTLVALQAIYFPQFDGRFYVSVTAPLSEINTESTRILFIVLAMSAALLVIITIFLYYLIGRFTKPLIEFSKSTREIAKGNYGVRITEDYQDELALLKDSMNTMTERIEKSFGILQNILNGVDAFVYVTEPITGELLFINNKMKEVLDLSDDVIGEPCYRVIHSSEEGICEHCPRRRFYEDRETAVLWESHDNVTDKYYHNTSVFIDWIDNERAHLQHSVDITDLKKVTEEKTKAEEMSATKSAFLANMSHEIRTPMNSIIGFSELALDDDISDKTKNYLVNIHENSKWLLSIVDDILDISKIEAGKLELESIPFDMHDLFIACRSMIAPKADEKGIRLHFYAEPSIGKMPLGDPTRLRQVLTNILSNAVKFTSSGIVKIQSTIKHSTTDTVTMYFEIKDSGIGMTDEQIQRIFDLFTQAESGTTRKYGGTGLGLPITKHLVEMMGGTLEVESTVGVGSKFSFVLTFDTISVDNAKHLQQYETKVVVDELKKPTFKGEVLLCEDNQMNQQVICEHLARVGLETVVAENGKIGVDMVQKRKDEGWKQFDLIFMDVHMPVMDGLEAAERIYEIDSIIPIVALTANIMAHDREVYKQSKMVDFVGKPFKSQELWACLLKYFVPTHWQEQDTKKAAQEDDALMSKLISGFVAKNSSKYEEIEAALADGDIVLAHRLAHTIKSNAGQLGKTELQKIADEIEESLKDGKNKTTPSQMATFKDELTMVLQELRQIDRASASGNDNASDTDEPLDESSAKALLQELKPLIEDNDPMALDYTTRLKQIHGTEELIKAIDNFDFTPALIELEKLFYLALASDPDAHPYNTEV